jgi:chromosome segregation ATPase
MVDNTMLHDIIDQFDIENNFEYCFSLYCNFLEREGKWNLCENNRSKNNFRCRMRKCHKGDIEKSREFQKFENWIEKRKVREQKEVELRAIKINRQNEQRSKEELLKLSHKYIKLEKQLQEKDKEIVSLKEQIKLLEQKHETLLNKYLDECDSDSD